MALSPVIHVIEASESNQRLDRYVRRHFPHLSQGMIEKALRKRHIKMNSASTTSSYRLQENDVLHLDHYLSTPSETHTTAPKPQLQKPITAEEKAWINTRIIYEDEHMLVFNKPSGIASQGGSKIKDNLDALLNRAYASIHLVHRLDLHTSGVIIFAKTRQMATHLGDQFKNRSVEKTYEAILKGYIRPGEGTINASLMKKRFGNHEKVVVDPKGQKAVTVYRQLKKSRRGQLTYVEALPKTGRTHQLRVHFAYAECPILGDDKYSDNPEFISSTLCLHAKSLTIRDLDNISYTFQAPLPDHMDAVLNKYFA